MAKDPLRLSRSKWDSFIKCPKCFYLKEKHDIGPPGQPGHPINSRVDALLKEEFDLLRKDGKPHAIFKEYNLNFIPYNKLDPEVLAKYRNNFKGVEAKSKKTKYTLFGSLDDLWFNLDTKEIVVLDYKATSNKNLEDYKTSTKHYHKSYLRQLDFYAYLLKLNEYPVQKIGYWLICNAADENQKVFNKNVSFKTTLLPYELKTDYIEDILVELEKCLENKELPKSGLDCDNCRWFGEVKNLEKLISIDANKKKDFRKYTFKEVSKNNYEFTFHCGDLYTRENVSWDDDLEYCRSIIVNTELKVVKSLKVIITYMIPSNDDIDEMKEKNVNQYQIDPKKHLYTVELLNFNQDEGKFRICEEIWIGYENTIKELIKKLKNLKQIYFFGRHFTESENGFSFDLIDDDDYIRKNCNNSKWEDSMFIEPVDDKDYLEQLILLKKQVGIDVKINFESLSEESEKLIKQFKITD